LNKDNRTRTSLIQKAILILPGLLLSLVILEIGMRLGGFIILSLQEHRNQLSSRKNGAYNILNIRESTTQNQYPAILGKILTQREMDITFSASNREMGGTTEVFYASPWMQLSRSLKIHKPGGLLWFHMKMKMGEKGLWPFANYSQGDVKYGKRGLTFYLVETCFAEEEPSAREAFFKKALKLNPRNDGAYVGLGWLYQNQRDLTLAEASFKKAIELNSRNDRAYVGLGWLYQDQRDLTLAEASFKKAIELNPRNDRAYVGLGQSYKEQSNFALAEASFKKALELNPRNDEAYAGLGQLYQ